MQGSPSTALKHPQRPVARKTFQLYYELDMTAAMENMASMEQ
jgi:hypothetical protein